MKGKEENVRKYYDILDQIGEGGFSIVYKGKLKNKEEYRAIKILDKNKIKIAINKEYSIQKKLEDYIQDFNNEIKYIKECGDNGKNKNSVKYYEHFNIEDEFAIVIELCDENLYDVLKRIKRGFNLEEIYEILVQLNNTFKIMSKKKIAHRDLKLENILVKYDNKEKTKYTYKLTDYGVSKEFVSLTKRFSTKVGTLNLMAPEILRDQKYDVECDLWSLGIIIYILCFQKSPYEGDTQEAISNKIILGNRIFKKSSDPVFDDLIKKLLEVNPEKRLTWDEYFNHPFFINRQYKTEVNLILKVGNRDKKENEFKKIYFLENDSFGNDGKQSDKFINALNHNNSEIYINDKIIKFSNFFKPEKEGEYKIKIIFKEIIKNCSYMFLGCGNIISIDLSNFDSSNVTNMKHMFSTCYNLQNINFNNLNVSNVTDMSYMFNKCSVIKEIKFPSSFDTQNVTNMMAMFHWCQFLSEVNFCSSFTTNNVTNMKMMFGKCHNLKNLNLSNFNTENVNDMSYMFDQCSNLEEILIDPNMFVTDKAINMGHLFHKCNNLKNINLSSFNTENVLFFSYMFYNCQNLTNLDVSKFKILNNANLNHMFEGCSTLKELNLSNFLINQNNQIEKMLDNLTNIEKIIVNSISIQIYKEKFKDISYKFSND